MIRQEDRFRGNFERAEKSGTAEVFQGVRMTEWHAFDAIRQLRKGRKAGIGTGDFDIKRGEKYIAKTYILLCQLAN